MTGAGFTEIMLSTGLLARMFVAGFTKPVGRVLSWPMYCFGTIAVGSYCDGVSGQSRVLYDTVGSTEFSLSSDEVEIVSRYLAQEGVTLSGSGLLLSAAGTEFFILLDCHVVV